MPFLDPYDNGFNEIPSACFFFKYVLGIHLMMQDELTSSDRDHLWWLERSRVPFNIGMHVDLGCGGGGLGRALVELGVRTSIGVDIVDRDFKGELNPDTNAGYRFLKLDLNCAEWPEHIRAAAGGVRVDMVTAFDFLEHVESPWTTLKSIGRILNPGGRLVLTTPNVMSWERILKPSLWSGARDEQHKILLQPYSLRFLLERAGYRLELLKSPLRKLGPIGWHLPIGGQMIAVARLI